MDVGHVCEQVKKKCADLRSAVERGDEDTAKSVLLEMTRLIAGLSPETEQKREDSAFFAGELASSEGEKSVRYPHVEEYRRRREKRLAARKK